jgi:MarR family transcriptional regulator, temperature-dependent positive regulator of motility
MFLIMNVRLMTKADSRPLPHPDAPIALARRLYQIALGVVAEVHANTDLRPLEFGVLTYLHHRPGVDQNTLVEQMVLDRTSVSAMVYHLEQLGLIERTVNAVDRRARVLRLSARGKALHDRQLPKARAAQDRIFAVLKPAERRSLIDMLKRVIEANQSYVRPGARPLPNPPDQPSCVGREVSLAP